MRKNLSNRCQLGGLCSFKISQREVMPYNKTHNRKFIGRGERKAEKGAEKEAETGPWGQDWWKRRRQRGKEGEREKEK